MPTLGLLHISRRSRLPSPNSPSFCFFGTSSVVTVCHGDDGKRPGAARCDGRGHSNVKGAFDLSIVLFEQLLEWYHPSAVLAMPAMPAMLISERHLMNAHMMMRMA